MGQLGSSKMMRPASDSALRHLADNTLHSNTRKINKADETKHTKLCSPQTAVASSLERPRFQLPGVTATSGPVVDEVAEW